MFIVAQKQQNNNIILIVTDKDVFGKCHIEGRKQLDLSADFYKGEEVTEVARELLKKAAVLHLSGKAAVALGVEADLVDPWTIITIAGVPHAVVVEG